MARPGPPPNLASKISSFTDHDLEACFDDVSAALVSCRLLSNSELDSLTDAARADLEHHLGLPVGSLHRTEEELCEAEARAAALPEGGVFGSGDVVLWPYAGLAVSLRGLAKRVELNGLAAIVLSVEAAERCPVRVCRTGEEIRVKLSNLQPYGWDPEAWEGWGKQEKRE